jgi:hypothetical protein
VDIVVGNIDDRTLSVFRGLGGAKFATRVEAAARSTPVGRIWPPGSPRG